MDVYATVQPVLSITLTNETILETHVFRGVTPCRWVSRRVEGWQCRPRTASDPEEEGPTIRRDLLPQGIPEDLVSSSCEILRPCKVNTSDTTRPDLYTCAALKKNIPVENQLSFGLCPSSWIKHTKCIKIQNHDVSEDGFTSVFR